MEAAAKAAGTASAAVQMMQQQIVVFQQFLANINLTPQKSRKPCGGSASTTGGSNGSYLGGQLWRSEWSCSRNSTVSINEGGTPMRNGSCH